MTAQNMTTAQFISVAPGCQYIGQKDQKKLKDAYPNAITLTGIPHRPRLHLTGGNEEGLRMRLYSTQATERP